MTNYREILKLNSLGFSERSITLSYSTSRNTVSKVLDRAEELKIKWPLVHDMIDDILNEMFFPKEKSVTNKRMPDFDYIRKELLRNSVNKNYYWWNTVRN